MPYDLICPCFWIDEDLFEDNLKSWIHEIKPERIFLGVNNPNILIYLREIKEKYPIIELVHQTHLRTLGGCLADLMKRVETEWFVYCHADIRMTPYSFLVMQQYQKEDVGIIESHREHWDGEVKHVRGMSLPEYKPSNYYFRKRSFSGLQLIQMRSIKSLVDRLEDDFLYRNEDMIFHAECYENGFKYCKTWAMHIHQTTNTEWTFNDEEAHRMQYRGFIKYSKISGITEFPCLIAIRYMKQKYDETLMRIIHFAFMYSNEWAEKIIERWESLP